MIFYIIISIILFLLLLSLLPLLTNSNATIKYETVHVAKHKTLEFVHDKRYLFTKSLRHNNNLICNREDYNEFMNCLTTKKLDMDYYGNMKMVNISSSFNNTYDHLFENIKLPSEGILYEKLDTDMLELYNMAVCRDVPFSQYDSELTLFSRIELNKSANELFRDDSAPGFYVSQFIYYPHNFMGKPIDQRYNHYLPGADFGIMEDEVVKIQNGIVTQQQSTQLAPTYVRTGRDLARYVYPDNPLVYAQKIYAILTANKVPMKFKTKNEQLFIDGGIIDIHSLAVDVGRISLIKCWKLKYKYCLMRPEAYGFHFNNYMKGNSDDYEFSDSLIESMAVKKIYEQNQNYLLPQTYPEGSPCHPSYPAGHSTFIGAIITIFKAFYDEEFEIDEYLPSDDGLELINTGKKVKIGDELDKLASNISIGRLFAGVHYRIDGEGVYLGQEVAINYLKKRSKEYAEIRGLYLKDREGNIREII